MKKVFTIFTILTIFLFSGVVFCQSITKDDAVKLIEEKEKLKEIPTDSLHHWKVGGFISLNGQQVSLTNWSAGGNNSVSVGGLVNVFAKYRNQTVSWVNNLEMGYGLIKQGDYKKWIKNDDRIQFTSKFGKQASKKWYYTALTDFKTQFTNGYNYPNDSIYISKFMAPGYILTSVGMDFLVKENFSIFLSPFTGKFTIVNDDTLASRGAFGVQKEIRDQNNPSVISQHYLKHREEFGSYVKLQYKGKVAENITFQSVLELFSNYVKIQNIDVNWTTFTTFKVNKFISATLSTQLVYDDDIRLVRNAGSKKGTIGPDVQFKQTMAIGFTYKF